MATEMNSTRTKSMELVVPDVCCVECSQGVVSSLRRASGVCDLHVLSMSEKVIVTFDVATTPESIVQSVERAGYDVKTWRRLEQPEESGVPGARGAAPTVAPHAVRTADVAPSHGVPSTPSRQGATFAVLRLAFVGVVSLIALLEIAGESLGLLHGVEELVPAPLALAVVVLGGYPIFRGAFFGLRAHRINTDAVMSVGILAAAAIGQFISSALIVFFVIVAHYLEDKTTGRARQAIAELATLLPKTARVKREQGEEDVPVALVYVGDVVVVRAGEQIPVDGTVLSGNASVNQAPITGESMPVEKQMGEEVYAATVNERGYLEVRVQRIGEQTTVGRIIHLVEEAEAQKSPVQRFADRFSAAFLPLVLTLAALTFLLSHNTVAAIAVLVAACPCAVGLATPLSVVAAVGAGARRGLLIKGGLALETMARVDTLVVDKTGTLTAGRPAFTQVVPFASLDADELVRLAAGLEQVSSHPLATALLDAATSRGLSVPAFDEVEMVPSRGMVGRLGAETLALGARRLLDEQGIALSAEQERVIAGLEQAGQTVLVLARSGQLLGALAFADTIRPAVRESLDQVRRLGIARIVLLTGDNERVAQEVARQAGIDEGIDEVAANLLPEDKIATVRRLQQEGRCVLMVGDGINDAPALTQANVGIAMGGIGTAVAQEAADVALLRDDWRQVPEAIRLGRRTAGTIRQNIFFGIGFTMLVMGLAAFGLIGPVIAAASQSVPDVAVALNASRLLGAARAGTKKR